MNPFNSTIVLGTTCGSTISFTYHAVFFDDCFLIRKQLCFASLSQILFVLCFLFLSALLHDAEKMKKLSESCLSRDYSDRGEIGKVVGVIED